MRKYNLFLIFHLLLTITYSCKKDTPVNSPALQDKTFVILGSSTAFGIGASSIDSSWAGLVTAQFKKDQKLINVINLALPGFTTYHILSKDTLNSLERPKVDFERNVAKALSYHPDFIIINLPSNDIANNYSNSEIIENYKKITSAISEHKGSFLITSSQPRNFVDTDQRKRLKLFNAQLETEYPDNVYDYYDDLTAPSYIIKPAADSGDGIHLNNLGHRIIFEGLFKNKLFLEKAGY